MSGSFDPRLHVACAEGNTDDIEALLKAGFDVNMKDYEGRRPLHVAAAKGSPAICALLLKANAEVNATDSRHRTPYLEASSDEVKEQLEHAGAITAAEYYETPQPNEEKSPKPVKGSKKGSKGGTMESTDKVSKLLLQKVIFAVTLPFLFLLFVNGVEFALKFTSASLAFYFVVIAFFVAEITIKPPWYHHNPKATTLTMDALPDYWLHVNDPKHNLGLEYEDVEFKSSDNYTLRGWYVPGVGPKKKSTGILLVHGGGRDRRAWLRHVPIFAQAGYSCVLFDLREHGMSSGDARGVTFGMTERFDVVAAAKYMKSRGFKKIAAVGTSVGGSSVIMAAAIEPTIDIVVAENPVLTCAHLQDQHIVKTLGGYTSGSRLGTIAFALFRRCCSSWLNFKVGNKPSKKCQAMHVVSKLERPILLMHGTYDDVVPPQHSKRLFELAKEPKELWLCPKAHHCGLWNVDREKYEATVLSFLKRHE